MKLLFGVYENEPSLFNTTEPSLGDDTRTELNAPPSAEMSLDWTPGAATVSGAFSLVKYELIDRQDRRRRGDGRDVQREFGGVAR